MNDQNQNNQPLDQSVPGIVPPTPPVLSNPPVEDITPVETPQTPSTDTTTFAVPQTAPITPLIPETPVISPVSLQPIPNTPPLTTPEPAVFPPVTETLPTPEPLPTSPLAAPMGTPTEVSTTPVSGPSEPPLPVKPKRKISPVVSGLLALLLVAGVAGASYYVSNQLSTRQAVAPTAPESQPSADVGFGGQQLTTTPAPKPTQVSGIFSGWTSTGLPTPVKATPIPSVAPNVTLGCPSACTYGCTNGQCNPAPSQTGASSGGSTSTGTTTTCNKAGGQCVNASSCANAGLSPVSGSGCGTSVCCSKTVATQTACQKAGGTCYSTSNCGRVGLSLVNGGNGCASVQEICCGASTTTVSSGGSKGTCENYCGAPNASGIYCTSGNVQNATCRECCCGTKAVQCDGRWKCGLNCNEPTPSVTITPTTTVTPIIAACIIINIHKKIDGVYDTTPLTETQLTELKIGDVLKFSLNSNTDNLRGRFRVTIGTTAGNWLNGTVDASNKKLVTYNDYTVATAGKYKFEAQVSKTP